MISVKAKLRSNLLIKSVVRIWYFEQSSDILHKIHMHKITLQIYFGTAKSDLSKCPSVAWKKEDC